MTSPAVRITPGHGIALRTSGIIAWIAPPPNHPGAPEVDLSGLVRDLVLAAGQAPGTIPAEFLTGLTDRHPWLTLAVVALGSRQGEVWTHGDADVTIERDGQSHVIDGQAGTRLTESFPLPSRTVRLGDPQGAASWSHLVEGAVPADGVAVVWGTADRGPAERRFEAIPLLDPQPMGEPKPLPVMGQHQHGPAGDPGEAGSGVTVAGLRCSRGHFNHPLAANCAWCGLSMIQVSHVLVRGPRPPLGVLVVDGLATFTLDADYVIGRQPQHLPEVDGTTVRELVLAADPSISRAHTAIRLRGWDVLAEDLNSGMGTWVQQPGQPPVQLPPGNPVALVPGAVLFLGQHRLTYHSHHRR
jgi:hypothetical protein